MNARLRTVITVAMAGLAVSCGEITSVSLESDAGAPQAASEPADTTTVMAPAAEPDAMPDDRGGVAPSSTTNVETTRDAASPSAHDAATTSAHDASRPAVAAQTPDGGTSPPQGPIVDAAATPPTIPPSPPPIADAAAPPPPPPVADAAPPSDADGARDAADARDAPDARDAGTCPRGCPLGQTCKSGKCHKIECGDGSVLCGLTCAFVKSDDANCGGCGRVCLFGRRCDDGKCK